MDREAHAVARNVDAVVPIMFWDPAEFVIALALFGFGMLANAWLFGACGAGFVLWGAKRLKRGAKPGATNHWLWSKGLAVDKPLATQFPSPTENDFFE